MFFSLQSLGLLWLLIQLTFHHRQREMSYLVIICDAVRSRRSCVCMLSRAHMFSVSEPLLILQPMHARQDRCIISPPAIRVLINVVINDSFDVHIFEFHNLNTILRTVVMVLLYSNAGFRQSYLFWWVRFETHGEVRDKIQ